MIHLNSNRLCAIVATTSGLKVGKHDLIQLCVLPLKSNLRPDLTNCVPFDILIQPKRPENFDPEFTKLKFAQVMMGVDAWKASDIFEEWFEKLKLPRGKKIMVLTHEWARVSPFLVDWLQPLTFDNIFHPEVRDIRTQQHSLMMLQISIMNPFHTQKHISNMLPLK